MKNSMNARQLLCIAMLGALVPVAAAQEVPTMKMTTEIPEGVTTPDNIQTRVGELDFFDGVPDVESAQKVYNLLDFTHATRKINRKGIIKAKMI